MAKAGRVGRVVGLVAATVGAAAGCTGLPPTDPAPEGILFSNRTGVWLEYVYLAPGVGDERDEPEHRILRLEDGGSAVIEPLPLRLNCTVAPIVARQRDGTEVARLPADTCWDPELVWELDAGDL